jgi:hypothetical protein
MTEAFEIGITLALDNGVSAGIAAIRQDLDALDRAIASSAAGLLTLRRLSAGLATSTSASPPLPTPALRSVPASTETASDPAPPLPTIAVLAPTFRPAPASPAFIEPQPSLPPSIASAAAPALSSRPPLIQPQAPASRPPPASPPMATAALPTITTAQQVLARPHAAPNPAAPARLAEPSAAAPLAVPFPPPRSTPLEPPIAPRPTLSMDQEIRLPSAAPLSRQPPVAHPQTPPPQNHFSPVPIRPAAPVAPASRPAWLEPFQLPAASPAASGSTRNRTANPPHGEIILDSVRLGRWMADRLARAADRPQSGTTGFDPRVSPSYAGAPNGS